jgi:hypothetical protein
MAGDDDHADSSQTRMLSQDIFCVKKVEKPKCD